MTCQELSKFLMDYLDGVLAGESRSIFEQHLAACPECRDYLISYQSTIALGRAAYCEPSGEFADPLPTRLVAAILASRRADLRAASERGQRPLRDYSPPPSH